MGAIHEETTNGVPISSCNQGFGSRTTNARNSAWRLGGGENSSRVRSVIGSDKRGGQSGRQENLGRSQGADAGGVRASHGNTAGTSSVHRQEMGGGRQEEKGHVMKTLVTANQKGGVGKTSTLVHLAFDFYERGKKVAVIDLDTQGNASYTLQEFRTGVVASNFFNGGPFDVVNGGDAPGMALIESDAALANMETMSLGRAGEHFRAGIASLAEQGFDVCLIDTAPSLGVSMAAALIAADYVLSPIELEAYSIQGIKKMNAAITNVRKANPKLQFLGMVPSKVDGRNPRHGRHLEQLQQAFPQLMLPTTIGLRSSIADALASGVPVWKIKKTAARKAAKEVRALADLVFTKMEITA